MKVKKDNSAVKAKVAINLSLADTEDNNIIIDDLKKYFSGIEQVAKVWCEYEFYNVNVLKIYVKVNAQINTNIENDVRKICFNRSFNKIIDIYSPNVLLKKEDDENE